MFVIVPYQRILLPIRYIYLPFRTSVIIKPFNGSRRLLKTYVVKSCKRSTTDVLNSVIGYQEMLFPPHENEIRLRQRLVIKSIRIEIFSILTESTEFSLKRKNTFMSDTNTHVALHM